MLLETKDNLANVEAPERRDSLVCLERLATLVSLVLMVLRVNVAHLVWVDPQDLPASQALRENVDHQDSQVLLERLDLLVPLASLENQDHVVRTAKTEPQV